MNLLSLTSEAGLETAVIVVLHGYIVRLLYI